MYSSCHISELQLLASCSVWHSGKMNWHFFTSCQALMHSLTPDHWPQYPSIGATRQQSVYLAGSCNLYAYLAARSGIGTRWFLPLLCFLWLPPPILVAVLLQNRLPLLSFPPASPQEELLLPSPTGSTPTSVVSSWLQECLLWLGLCLWFSHSIHLYVLRSRDAHAPSRVLDTGLVVIGQAPTQHQSLSVFGVSKTSFLQSAISAGFRACSCVNSQATRGENCSRQLPKFSHTPSYPGISCLRALSCVSSPTGWLLEVPQRFELGSLDSESEDGLVDY